MKRAAGYVATFLAGSILTAGVAWADTLVQAEAGDASIFVEGSRVSSPPKLVYDDTTYLPIWYIFQALNLLGVHYTWDGTNLSLTSDTSSQYASGSGSDSANQDDGTPLVPLSKLPYTYTSPNGMQLTIQSISREANATVLQLTLTNGGKVAGDASMLTTFILAGNQYVGLVAQDPQFTGQLQPGTSVSGNVTLTGLPEDTKQFTLYFQLTEGYSTDRQNVTFDTTQ
ncbi:hypothetical protein [Alicyclobacillus sp.]|uniref:hypothetical protein n=1 Tax=Alicyclobacillus sp. TaxID=61169 RepID=UPI0025BF225D|nr:hypothetical protein [Alicyclobacillus sp.]MCL6517997.1 hypothetical protein [Alicyclobacillus sp.]